VSQKPPIPVHSIQEEHLFVLLAACPCGHSYELVSQTLLDREDGKIDRIDAKCPSCGAEEQFFFDVGGFFGDRERYASLEVNPTGEPSRAIDLEGWTRLALFYLTLRAQTETDSDRLHAEYMAAQCLDEALRMFSPGEETPSVDAFFRAEDDAARRDLRKQESFARSSLQRLRADLPPIGTLRNRIRQSVENQRETDPGGSSLSG